MHAAQQQIHNASQLAGVITVGTEQTHQLAENMH